MLFHRVLIPSFVILMTIGSYGAARAALITGDCANDVGTDGNDYSSISGAVISNSGCAVSSEQVEGSPPALVNSEEFFGFDDWTFDGKFEDDPSTTGDPSYVDGSAIVGLTDDCHLLPGGCDDDNVGLSGTWSLATDNWDIYSEILLIFKDGSNTTLVGYLLTSADGLSGTWDTPFTNPPFDVNATRQTSHISVYYRESDGLPPTEVPEPGSVLLLGSGLLGLAGWRASRRR